MRRRSLTERNNACPLRCGGLGLFPGSTRAGRWPSPHRQQTELYFRARLVERVDVAIELHLWRRSLVALKRWKLDMLTRDSIDMARRRRRVLPLVCTCIWRPPDWNTCEDKKTHALHTAVERVRRYYDDDLNTVRTPAAARPVVVRPCGSCVQFKREAAAIRRLRHANIVRFLGVVIDPPAMAIAMEFAPRGDLFSHLAKV